MIDYHLLLSVLIGVSILIILILKFKIQPFLGLLISSILVGILAGVAPLEIMNTVKEGMGSTLGFVAVVVGLGAMFGAILEHSGGAEALAQYLLKAFGEKNAAPDKDAAVESEANRSRVTQKTGSKPRHTLQDSAHETRCLFQQNLWRTGDRDAIFPILWIVSGSSHVLSILFFEKRKIISQRSFDASSCAFHSCL